MTWTFLTLSLLLAPRVGNCAVHKEYKISQLRASPEAHPVYNRYISTSKARKILFDPLGLQKPGLNRSFLGLAAYCSVS